MWAGCLCRILPPCTSPLLWSRVTTAARVARERGVEPAPLMLAYWRDAAQWAKAHPEDGDAGMWRVENAAARLAADRLHAMGLPVAIAYAEPEA